MTTQEMQEHECMHACLHACMRECVRACSCDNNVKYSVRKIFVPEFLIQVPIKDLLSFGTTVLSHCLVRLLSELIELVLPTGALIP